MTPAQTCTSTAAAFTSTTIRHWYFFKLILLAICLFIVDLTLNATSEFQNFDDGYSNKDTREDTHKIHILLCSVQFLGQMSSFTILFSILCDTFPFQIGLIGVLMERFTSVLLLNLVYIVLTLILSGVRLVCSWTIQ